MLHIVEEIKVFLKFGLSELGVHLVVDAIAPHVLLDDLSHLILVELKSLRNETPSVPFFKVLLDFTRCNLAALHPLFYLLHVYPVPELTLNSNSGFLLLDNLGFDFQTHQQVLFRQILYLPLRDGNAEPFGVKLGQIPLCSCDLLFQILPI